MIITTTPDVEGQRVVEYCGIVTGEAVMGANIFLDIGASIRNIIGGRAAGYEEKLMEGRQEAIREMETRANALGCDAVIGVKIDHEAFSPGNSGGMLMVIASGTAVRLKDGD